MARKGSFLESFAKGFKFGALIGEYVEKRQDKKKSKELFDKLSKDEELVKNPAKFWSTYASKLVAAGIVTPEQAQDMMAKGVQQHVAQLQLERMQTFDNIKKEVEGRIKKATQLYEKGDIAGYVQTIRPILQAQSTLPDGKHYQIINKDGQVYIQAYSDIDGTPLGKPTLMTPDTLAPAATALMMTLSSTADPTALQNFYNLMLQGKRALEATRAKISADKETAAADRATRLQVADIQRDAALKGAAFNALGRQEAARWSIIANTLANGGGLPQTLNLMMALDRVSRNNPVISTARQVFGPQFVSEFSGNEEALKRAREEFESILSGKATAAKSGGILDRFFGSSSATTATDQTQQDLRYPSFSADSNPIVGTTYNMWRMFSHPTFNENQ